MIVDDDPDTVELYLSMMQDMDDCEVVASASNGRDAVDQYMRMDPKPDIVIMDENMPEMNGREAMARMREINPYQPIIFVTGDYEAATRAVREGAVCFVMKPFRMDALHNAIKVAVAEIDSKRKIVREKMLAIAASMGQGMNLRKAFATLEREVLSVYVNNGLGPSTDPETGLARFKEFANTMGASASICRENGTLILRNERCPWENEIPAPNPVFCQMCRGLLSQMAANTGHEYSLRADSTIMNGDKACVFRLAFQ